jgi:hypothetical protein
MAKQPGGYIAGSQVLSPLAQQGILTEADGTKVNLFTQVAQPNGLPNCVATPSICQAFATQQALISKAVASGGVSLSDSGDANVQNVSWLVPSPTTKYYPAFRVDYNASQKVRIDFSFEETKVNPAERVQSLFPRLGFCKSSSVVQVKQLYRLDGSELDDQADTDQPVPRGLLLQCILVRIRG